MFPAWLPPKKRTAGARYAQMTIKAPREWNGRTVSPAKLAIGWAYYDPTTGFLVGGQTGGVGIGLILAESNVPGLELPTP